MELVVGLAPGIRQPLDPVVAEAELLVERHLQGVQHELLGHPLRRLDQPPPGLPLLDEVCGLLHPSASSSPPQAAYPAKSIQLSALP